MSRVHHDNRKGRRVLSKSGNIVTWTPEMDDFLGKLRDCAIASKYKIPCDQVTKRRNVLGIAGFGRVKTDAGIGWAATTSNHVWTQEDDSLLGTRAINKIASHLGIPIREVRERMVTLNIPVPLAIRLRQVQWTSEMDIELSKRHIKEASNILGVSIFAVNKRRAELNLTNSENDPVLDIQVSLNYFVDFMLGQTKTEISKQYGVTRGRLNRRLEKFLEQIYRYFKSNNINPMIDTWIDFDNLYDMRKYSNEWIDAARFYSDKKTIDIKLQK